MAEAFDKWGTKATEDDADLFPLTGYELAGRLTLLTALSFSLAGILWVLVFLDPGHFFLHSVVAAGSPTASARVGSPRGRTGASSH